MRQGVVLWIGLVTAPLAWCLSLGANFAIAPLACQGSGKWMLYLVSACALLLAVTGAAFAWSAIRARRSAMGFAGFGLSGLFILVILAQAIPNLLMGGCE